MDGIINSMDMSLSELWGIVKDREAWHAVFHGVLKSWIWLSDCTTSLFDGNKVVIELLLLPILCRHLHPTKMLTGHFCMVGSLFHAFLLPLAP